jgi:neuronal cell adhesion protein
MNDKEFDPSGNMGRIAIQPGSGTLIFADPLARDEAVYQCLAENQAGTALSIKTNLRVACTFVYIFFKHFGGVTIII